MKMLYTKNATLEEFSTLNKKILQHKQGPQLRKSVGRALFLEIIGGNWKQEFCLLEQKAETAEWFFQQNSSLKLSLLLLLPKLFDNNGTSYLTTMVRSWKPLIEQYKLWYLCKFMAFKDAFDGVVYPTTMEFSQEQLLSIWPHEIASWLVQKASLRYGHSWTWWYRPTECRACF